VAIGANIAEAKAFVFEMFLGYMNSTRVVAFNFERLGFRIGKNPLAVTIWHISIFEVITLANNRGYLRLRAVSVCSY
jgi:ribonucleotide reductase alpha subunit